MSPTDGRMFRNASTEVECECWCAQQIVVIPSGWVRLLKTKACSAGCRRRGEERLPWSEY